MLNVDYPVGRPLYPKIPLRDKCCGPYTATMIIAITHNKATVNINAIVTAFAVGNAGRANCIVLLNAVWYKTAINRLPFVWLYTQVYRIATAGAPIINQRIG